MNYSNAPPLFSLAFSPLQQFGPILDVEIIFNERGSKVSTFRFRLNANELIS